MDASFAFIQNFGWTEILVILAVLLLIFGPQRLPEIAEAMGRSIRKFKSATRELQDEVTSDPKDRRDPPQD